MRVLLRPLIAALILLTGCVSVSGVLPEARQAEIPDGAQRAVVAAEIPADSLYSALYATLGRTGYGVQQAERPSSITTQPKPIGEETTVAIRVFVERTKSGSRATLRGAWGLTSASASAFSAAFGSGVADAASNTAEWTRGRPKRAYGAVAAVAYGVNVGTVSHHVE